MKNIENFLRSALVLPALLAWIIASLLMNFIHPEAARIVFVFAFRQIWNEK